jgi:hypothetical protein
LIDNPQTQTNEKIFFAYDNALDDFSSVIWAGTNQRIFFKTT